MGVKTDPTLTKDHKLGVSENRAPRRLFGPKREKMTGGWRKSHNGDLHNLCSSPNVIRINKSGRMRLRGHTARMEDIKRRPKTSEGKFEGRRLFERSENRFQENIKMGL
jgi:hypothetical protein